MHPVAAEQNGDDGDGLPRDSELLDDPAPQRTVQLEDHGEHDEERQRHAVHVDVRRCVPTERGVTEGNADEVSEGGRQEEIIKAHHNSQHQARYGAGGLCA